MWQRVKLSVALAPMDVTPVVNSSDLASWSGAEVGFGEVLAAGPAHGVVARLAAQRARDLARGRAAPVGQRAAHRPQPQWFRARAVQGAGEVQLDFAPQGERRLAGNVGHARLDPAGQPGGVPLPAAELLWADAVAGAPRRPAAVEPARLLAQFQGGFASDRAVGGREAVEDEPERAGEVTFDLPVVRESRISIDAQISVWTVSAGAITDSVNAGRSAAKALVTSSASNWS